MGNLTGLPAVVAPAGQDDEGLPVGVQIVGPRWSEMRLLGVCRALGWPARDQADIARAWQRILGKVSSYRDLEPELLGRVEELIDFVTQD